MRIVQQIYSFISSMKTGLVILLLIGLASAAGSTILPETFFKTTVFELLLLMLLLNMLLCTLRRFSQTYRMLSKRVGSKVWFRQAGILLLHLGIVLILVGGILYTTVGQEERIHILNGETADISEALDVKHPFSIQLHEFRIDFNDDGSPSQYVSEVAIMEKGQAIKDVSISVNNPLSYRGVKAYQTSFGYLINAQYTDQSGKQKSDRVIEGDIIEPGGTNKVVKVYRYIPNFDPQYGMTSVTMRPDNPHVVYSVYEDDMLLGVGAAPLNEQVTLEENVQLLFTSVEPYTILTVKSDPGLPLVLAGGITLMLGVCLALLAAPVRKKLNQNV